MKINQQEATPNTIDNFQGKETAIGMSEQGADMAAFFLRDKIYTKKELAVVREYVCNAIDEHKKHNIERPIDVTIPTRSNLSFRVRDYANGLSDEHVRMIFGQYFESTKSKDNKSIGGFGIGSKAGHAYTDQFFVTSWFEGVETMYIFGLEGGKMSKGSIVEVSQQESDQPSGIEVMVPVKEHDTYKFGDAIRSLYPYLAKWVKVTGYDTEGCQKVLNNDKFGVTMSVSNDYNHRVVCGCVSYTIDTRFMESCYAEASKYTKDILDDSFVVASIMSIYSNNPIYVRVPIGSVDISVSRETLEESDKTKVAISKAILNFVKNSIKTVTTIVNGIKKIDDLNKLNVIVEDTTLNRIFQSMVDNKRVIGSFALDFIETVTKMRQESDRCTHKGRKWTRVSYKVLSSGKLVMDKRGFFMDYSVGKTVFFLEDEDMSGAYMWNRIRYAMIESDVTSVIIVRELTDSVNAYMELLGKHAIVYDRQNSKPLQLRDFKMKVIKDFDDPRNTIMVSHVDPKNGLETPEVAHISDVEDGDFVMLVEGKANLSDGITRVLLNTKDVVEKGVEKDTYDFYRFYRFVKHLHEKGFDIKVPKLYLMKRNQLSKVRKTVKVELMHGFDAPEFQAIFDKVWDEIVQIGVTNGLLRLQTARFVMAQGVLTASVRDGIIQNITGISTRSRIYTDIGGFENNLGLLEVFNRFTSNYRTNQILLDKINADVKLGINEANKSLKVMILKDHLETFKKYLTKQLSLSY